ncbi:MAG: ribose 5-phosphate isomerase A [Candidatus Hodarchaeales archaeon]|jgi:ribose 5-phosphate isomerase A
MDPESIERAKIAAARLAISQNIHDGVIIGVGSGSTIVYAVHELAALVLKNNWKIMCIPTSYQAKNLIIDNKLPLGSLDQYPELDIAIDGTDEITLDLNLIKGGGGCLVQEKIVADNAKKVIIIADWRKVSSLLGEYWIKGVPIEIIPEVRVPITQKLKNLGGEVKLRKGIAKIGPLITDNGNFILDVNFGIIENPEKLACQLKVLTGVIDSGLFVKMVSKAYIGQENGQVKVIE